MQSPTENLLIEIRLFLLEKGMVPSAFGSRSIGDPNLVSDLNAGRELRHGTLMKVRAFMDSYERESA
jgi:hypothetical protein